MTYASYACDYRPLKDELHRERITIEGDRLNYKDDARFPAANLLETKILLNSVTSDAHVSACFMSTDTKDHFLVMTIDGPECVRVAYKYMP